MCSLSRQWPVLLLVLVLFNSVARGSEEQAWREHGSVYEQAREAVRRGEALPLHLVRAHLQRIAPGKIVATHYEFEFERWVYEFKIVDPQGRLRKVHLDARSGELVKVSDY
jgi:uncharacterized membrane protein YkoI